MQNLWGPVVPGADLAGVTMACGCGTPYAEGLAPAGKSRIAIVSAANATPGVTTVTSPQMYCQLLVPGKPRGLSQGWVSREHDCQRFDDLSVGRVDRGIASSLPVSGPLLGLIIQDRAHAGRSYVL